MTRTASGRRCRASGVRRRRRRSGKAGSRHGVQRGEAELVEDEQGGPQDGLDEPGRPSCRPGPDRAFRRARRPRSSGPGARSTSRPERDEPWHLPVRRARQGTGSPRRGSTRASRGSRRWRGGSRTRRRRTLKGFPAGTRRPHAGPGVRGVARGESGPRGACAGARLGAQRWTLAVTSTSGAILRTAASLSRRSAASRSGARRGDRRGHVRPPRWHTRRGAGSGAAGRSRAEPLRPAPGGGGTPAPAARMGSARRQACFAAATRQAEVAALSPHTRPPGRPAAAASPI